MGFMNNEKLYLVSKATISVSIRHLCGLHKLNKINYKLMSNSIFKKKSIIEFAIELFFKHILFGFPWFH